MNRRRVPFCLLRFSILFALLFFFLKTADAQDDLFITVSAPTAGAAAPSAEENGLFTTVSSADAQPAPAAKSVTQPAVTEKESVEKWAYELLRDPFWPVGFFPEGWKKKTTAQGDSDLDGSGWKAASGKLRISGTSRLGGRTAAIINGELKAVGEQIEVQHEGKIYQWQIVGIDAEGRIQLKKQTIK